MKLRNWDEVVFEDIPEPGPITEDVVKKVKVDSNKYRGSVRMASGRIWIDEEFEKYRREILNRPLP